MSKTDADYGLELARRLIGEASVTPAAGACLEIVCAELEPLGFVADWLPVGEVHNLWLRCGNERPLFCFVGHVDVVPSGPVEQWRYPPFAATVADGCLWGRGAADMKGGVAAMVAACRRFVAEQGAPKGSIVLLLTSDEEGPAVDGTARVVERVQGCGHVPDWALVGEPSCVAQIGDRIRAGRRGSVHCHLVVRGLQGHVAYPELVRNPIHAVAPLLDALAREDWSRNETEFPPTSLQLTQAQAGTGALNVVPGEFRAHFNLRHSPDLPVAEIRQRVDELVAEHLPTSSGFGVELNWVEAANPYRSPPGGKLRQAVCGAVQALTGLDPEVSTGGGTSDGRFLAAAGSEVVELGLCTETIHQIDERIPVEQLKTLEDCYLEILKRLLT